jgi:hypothetical protein
VFKNFSRIHNLRNSDVGTYDGAILKWKAVYGRTLQSSVILNHRSRPS